MEFKDRGQRYWWAKAPLKRGGVSVHEAVVPYAQFLRQQAATINWRDRVYECIYEDERFTKSDAYADVREMLRASGFTASTLNKTRHIVNTIVARIGHRRPAIKVDATDVNYSLKRRARQLTRFIVGEQKDMETDVMGPFILRDGIVRGTGVSKIYSEDGDIKMEQVAKRELFVDLREAKYGNPRQIHQVKYIPREVLAEMYGDDKLARGAIMLAPPAQTDGIYADAEDVNAQADLIEVWESWHLPSGRDAKDGRHAICIAGATLEYEEWNRPRFPFAFFRYARPMRGFWGRSLVQDLAPTQRKINEQIKDIQESLYIGGQLKVFGRKGSGVNKNSLGRNRGVAYIEVDAPGSIQHVVPQTVAADQMEYIKFMLRHMDDTGGISSGAGGPIQAGANTSGVARQEIWDWESEQLNPVEREYAQWHLEVARICIDEAKAMAEAGGEIRPAKWHNRSVLHLIKWKDVNMKDDQYSIGLEPANFVPETRAGKLQAADTLAKMGVIQGPWVSQILGGFPDIERANRVRNAPLETIEWIMDQVEDEDVPLGDIDIDGYLNLDLAKETGMALYGRARTEGAPEPILERFRYIIDLIAAEIEKRDGAPPSAAEQLAKMQAAGAGAGGLPGALPPAPAPTALGPEGAGVPGLAPPANGFNAPIPTM